MDDIGHRRHLSTARNEIPWDGVFVYIYLMYIQGYLCNGVEVLFVVLHEFSSINI